VVEARGIAARHRGEGGDVSNVPPPRASPGHPIPDDADSGVRQLTVREARERMEVALAAAKAEGEREAAEQQGQAKADAFTKRLWATAAAAVVIVVGTASAIAWGQHALDAGVAPVKEDLQEFKKSTAAELSAVKADVKEAVRSSNRAEVMTEMLLRNRGIKPPPKDGGEP
jgi:hypothetical protein